METQSTTTTKREVLQQNVSQPTASQPTASQPTVSQPTVSQPIVSQPTVSQKTVSQKTVQQKDKPIASSSLPLSSYKSIIIVLCVSILLWMLLQGGNKGLKDTFHRSHENTDKVQSTKDTMKNSYENVAESTKTTFQNVADKIKNLGENVKSMYDEKVNSVYESSQENKEHVKNKVTEMTEDAKQKAKETVESLKEKSQDTLETARTTSQEALNKAKEKLSETQNILSNFDMISLIDQAYSNLKAFMNPHLKVEEQIPFTALSEAKAVVFLTVMKGGIGLGGTIGSGIIIARNEIGHWSGPCAIGLVGLDVGLNIGVEKSDHIIVLRDDTAIRAFSGKGQFKLGMDASIAIGPTGRDATVGFAVGDKGYSSMFSYSLAKGAYIGVSFEGQVIAVRDDCNEQYYGTKVDANKILDGTIKPPKNKHLTNIYKIIDEYAARNLVYPEHYADL